MSNRQATGTSCQIFIALVVGIFCCGLALADFEKETGFKKAADSRSLNTFVNHAEWRLDLGRDAIGVDQYSPQGNPNSNLIPAVVLYLPGTNMNGRPTGQTSQYHLPLYLAEQGVTVYAMNYRTAFVAPTYSGETDYMLEWSFSRFVDDAALVFEFIRSKHPNKPIYVAGFSRGAAYAYGVAGQVNAAGLVILDGSFKHYRESEFDRTAALAKLKYPASILSFKRGWENRQALMQSVIDNPAGPAMKEGLPSIGAELSQTLYHAWGEGALANPVDGVSDIQELAKMMLQYDRFFPARQNVDGAYIAAYKDAADESVDDHFGAIKLPILFFGAEGMGPKHLLNGIYSASESGSKDVTIHVLENYGHLDVLVGNEAKDEVFQVVLDWIIDKKDTKQ